MVFHDRFCRKPIEPMDCRAIFENMQAGPPSQLDADGARHRRLLSFSRPVVGDV
jgi:hypothetical protein